jgi:hypothetical protein
LHLVLSGDPLVLDEFHSVFDVWKARQIGTQRTGTCVGILLVY